MALEAADFTLAERRKMITWMVGPIVNETIGPLPLRKNGIRSVSGRGCAV